MLQRLAQRLAAWLLIKTTPTDHTDWDLVTEDWHYFHYVPIGDLITHDLDPDCHCGPTIERCKVNDHVGITHYLVTHAALDGRDLPDMPLENPYGLLDEHDG